ncbi:neck whiskers protein [Salmonella phage SE40]|nr:neck whiskers protein [Salmonella phage SE40]
MGFFKVKDVPSRRVVQYSRVSGAGEGVVYIKDESVLGESVDEMPFADKTGLATISDGILYEVPYLDGAAESTG